MMGRRGPKPKPTSILKLRGSRAVEKRGREIKIADQCDATPPAWLSRDAKAEYRRLAKLLIQAEVMTAADVGALCAVCVAYALWKRLAAQLEKKRAKDFESTATRRLQNACTDAQKAYLRSAAEFGLTPAGRVQISAKNPDAGDELDDLLKRRGT